MSDVLVDVVASRVAALRNTYPHASSQAWATLLVDSVRRFADEGPDARLQVAALAGMAVVPKQITDSGYLRRVRTEQILVTPRAQAKKRAGHAARA